MEMHIQDLFEKKARAGDGLFAIAYSLVDLAESQKATARALTKLGMNDAGTPMGAIETLAYEIKKAGQSVAEEIESVGTSINAASDKD